MLACTVVIASASERIQQGQIVYIGDTDDISGTVGWSSELVWAGRYADSYSVDNASIKYRLELPDTKKGYYNFYFDPKIFQSRLGWWYQYYGEYEKRGNLRAFYVKSERPINQSENTAEIGAPVVSVTPTPKPTPIIPEKPVSDYLVARGDPLLFPNVWGDDVSVWIFGRVDGVYDARFSGGEIEIDADSLENFEVGSYKMLVIRPGENGQIDCQYSAGHVKWFNIKTFTVGDIDADVFSPMVLLERIRQDFHETDDMIIEYDLELQDPYIEIVERDQSDVGDGSAIMRVRGYTNEVANKTVWITVDKDFVDYQNRHTYVISTQTMATDNPGAYRYFDAHIPVIWSNMTNYQHTIDAKTELGAESHVDFWIYTAPEGQQTPDRTIKYIGGNEFIPTPSPITITNETVKTVEVIRYDVKTEIVKEPVDYQKLIGSAVEMVLPWLVLGVGLAYLGRVAVKAYARGRRTGNVIEKERR